MHVWHALKSQCASIVVGGGVGVVRLGKQMRALQHKCNPPHPTTRTKRAFIIDCTLCESGKTEKYAKYCDAARAHQIASAD